MTWSNPAYLLGFWLVAAMIVLYAWSQRRTFRLLRALVSDNMSRSLLPRPGRTRAWIKGCFLLLALSLFCMTLAGPRFGFRIEKVSRRGTDLFVLLDTSRSMLAEDVAPNRLAGAKLDIEDLLAQSGGDRVGLIAFAGKPVTQVPLTTDFGFFRDVLHRIDTDTAPRGGTAIGDALRLAVRLLPPDPSRDKAIVLLTDGEDHESMPLEAAKDAAAAGVRIYTVALGDFKEGARIPLFDANGKRVGFEKYEGREVWSKADTRLLEEIARISGGAFIPAGTSVFDLGAIYSEHLESLKRSDSGQEEHQVPLLQYQLFLLGGIVAFLIFLAISPYSKKTPVALEANACFEQLRRAKSSGKSLPGIALFIVLSFTGAVFAKSETNTESHSKAMVSDTESAISATASPESKAGHSGSKSNDDSAGLEAASPTKIDSQNTSPDDRQTESLHNESSSKKYNRARSFMDTGSNDEAKSIFKELLLDRNGRISAMSQLNLGLLLARDIMENKQEEATADSDQALPLSGSAVPVPPGNIPGQPGVSSQGFPGTTAVVPGQSGAGVPAKSALEQYIEGRKKREESQEALRLRIREAVDHFAQAAKHPATAESARRNLDVVTSWQKQQERQWRQTEQEIRAKSLSFAELLQWLERNGRQADDSLICDVPQPDAATWQRWFDSGTSLRELDIDFDIATQKYDELKKQNKKPNSPGDQADDPVPALLAEAKKQYASASESLSQFDQAKAIPSLRDSIGRINALSCLLVPYPALVQSSVSFQEEQVKETKAALGQKDSPESLRSARNQKLAWNNQFVRRWVSLMMNHAQQEFEKNPRSNKSSEPETPLILKETDSPGSSPKEKTPPAGKNESGVKTPPTGKNESGVKTPPAGKSELGVKTSPAGKSESGVKTPPAGKSESGVKTPPSSGPKEKSPEEKIRESMELALKFGPLIQKEIDQLAGEFSSNKNTLLVFRQEKILDWLKEIAKPLQDPNQQNQDQPNPDQQNQDQQKENQQDQNKQDQDRQKDSQQADQKEPDKNKDRQDEASSAKEEKPDEKEKESLLRQIKQRQRDAQEERKAMDRFRRRTDKPEKDW